jgi:hypothetical protein
MSKKRVTINHSSLGEPHVFEFEGENDPREKRFRWEATCKDGYVLFEAGVEDEKVIRIFGNDVSMITEVGLDG